MRWARKKTVWFERKHRPRHLANRQTPSARGTKCPNHDIPGSRPPRTPSKLDLDRHGSLIRILLCACPVPRRYLRSVAFVPANPARNTSLASQHGLALSLVAPDHSLVRRTIPKLPRNVRLSPSAGRYRTQHDLMPTHLPPTTSRGSQETYACLCTHGDAGLHDSSPSLTAISSLPASLSSLGLHSRVWLAKESRHQRRQARESVVITMRAPLPHNVPPQYMRRLDHSRGAGS